MTAIRTEPTESTWVSDNLWPSVEMRGKIYSCYSYIYSETEVISNAALERIKEKVGVSNCNKVALIYNNTMDALNFYSVRGSTWVSDNLWPSVETREKMYACYSYISTKTVATSNAAYEGIKDQIYSRYHNKIAAIRDAEESTKQNLFIKTLLGGKEADPLFRFFMMPQLTQIFQTLEPEVKDTYLRACCKIGLETKNLTLITRAMSLVDPQEMLAVAATRIKKKGDLTLEQAVEYYKLNFNTNNEYFAYHRKLAFLKTEMQYILPFLIHRLTGIFELFNRSSQFLEPGQGGKSAWDDSHRWILLANILSVPTWIYTKVNNYSVHPLLTAAVFSLFISGLAIFIYSYNKWLKPAPNALPHGVRNLTHELKIGKIPRVCGRDSEVQDILKQLVYNSYGSNRKHPLIVGKSGLGKTTLINALVEKLTKPDSHTSERLKGLTVFLLTAKEISTGDLVSKDRLKEIQAAIGNHGNKVVLIIDEIQEILKSAERAHLLPMLDSSPGSLPFFLGITTEKKLEETREFQKDEFQRRFKEMKLVSTNEDPTIRILKENLKQKAPEIDVDDQRIFKKIYDLPKLETSLEPATSIDRLDELLGKIKCNLEGLHLEEKRSELDLLLETAKSNMVGSAPPFEKAEEVRQLERKIEEVEKQIAEHSRNVYQYKKLKVEIRDKEFLLNELASSIDTTAKANKFATQFLFEFNYLLPAMKEALNEFAKAKNLEVAITEELIHKTFSNKAEEKFNGENRQEVLQPSV